MTTSPAPAGPTPVPTTEDMRWEQEAQDARHLSLQSVRSTAEKWTSSVAGLLTAASTAVVFAAPSLTDLQPLAAWTLILGGFVASVLALTGLVLGLLAGQGTPQWTTNFDGVELRTFIEDETPRVIGRLVRSRVLVVLAAVVLTLTATATSALQVAVQGPEVTNILIVNRDGTLLCGPLGPDRGRLGIEGGEIKTARQILVVDECPE